MPKGSEELTNSRKEEIINACALLYKKQGFKDISISDIGAKTSFTRTSIYNYFQTKEEIFLALLQREYEAWTLDLRNIMSENTALSVEDFSDKLSNSLEKRGCMLKLMSMNLYDMEGNSRIENLVSFKLAYADAMRVLSCCLEKFFDDMKANDIQEFIYALFPFMFGVYPYTCATPKQKQAMELAHINYAKYSVYEITNSFVTKMLAPFRSKLS